MEFEASKEARVWQRVQTGQREENAGRARENLQALLMEQQQLGTLYRQLAGRINGKDGAVMIRLAREAGMQAACLKGIMTLMDGTVSQSGGIQQPLSNTEAVLRRCYGTELRLLKTYENRSSDAEYGVVFERMAARGREHCCTLLELIGGTGRPQTR